MALPPLFTTYAWRSKKNLCEISMCLVCCQQNWPSFFDVGTEMESVPPLIGAGFVYCPGTGRWAVFDNTYSEDSVKSISLRTVVQPLLWPLVLYWAKTVSWCICGSYLFIYEVTTTIWKLPLEIKSYTAFIQQVYA